MKPLIDSSRTLQAITRRGARLRSVIKKQVVDNSDILFERGVKLLSAHLQEGGPALVGTATSLVTKSAKAVL